MQKISHESFPAETLRKGTIENTRRKNTESRYCRKHGLKGTIPESGSNNWSIQHLHGSIEEQGLILRLSGDFFQGAPAQWRGFLFWFFSLVPWQYKRKEHSELWVSQPDEGPKAYRLFLPVVILAIKNRRAGLLFAHFFLQEKVTGRFSVAVFFIFCF